MMTEKHEECINFVAEILAVLKSAHQHEKVLHLIVDRIVRMYRCQTCAIITVDPVTEYLRVALSHGLSHTFSKAFHRKAATSAVGHLIWTGTPVYIPDSNLVVELSDDVKLENPFGSALCVVVAANHRSLGYLHMDSELPHAFSPDDIPIIQVFADFAALALNLSRLYEENLRLDRIDHDTGLEKYAPFLDRIQSAVDRSKEMSESFAILMLDVDNYKHIASTYGYDSAKAMLREMAGLLKGKTRSVDAAGRHGFDEFIVLRSNADLAGGILFADELRGSIAEKIFTEKGIRTTVSVGVAVYPQHATTHEGLLQAVKEALFDAQRAGRNKVSVAGNDVIPESSGSSKD